MSEEEFRNLGTFLEMAAAGTLSGNVSEWPQLQPACQMALSSMMAFCEEAQLLKKALLPLATAAVRTDRSLRNLPDSTGLWTSTDTDERNNFSITLGHARAAKKLLDNWGERTWE